MGRPLYQRGIRLDKRCCQEYVEDLIEVEPIGELSLKGFLKPVTTFNVLRFKDAPH